MQAKALIKKAHKAPFGKGSKTVLDTNVRSAWEIDSDGLTWASWERTLRPSIAVGKIK